MQKFFVIVGVIVVLILLVQSQTLEGRICVQQKCVGTMDSGVHLGDRSDFATGTQPTTTG